MNQMTLSQIERSIATLSWEEQMLLLERIIHRLRKKEKKVTIEEQMAQMASDPEIQAELSSINEEFAATEMDGLENM